MSGSQEVKSVTHINLQLHLLIKVSMYEVAEDGARHSLLLSVLGSLCFVMSCLRFAVRFDIRGKRRILKSRMFGRKPIEAAPATAGLFREDAEV